MAGSTATKTMGVCRNQGLENRKVGFNLAPVTFFLINHQVMKPAALRMRREST